MAVQTFRQAFTASLTSTAALPAGSGSVTFQAPPNGFVLTGTLSISGAGPSGQLTVIVGGNQVATSQGAAQVGPVQAFPTQSVVINAVGLTPGVVYTVTWLAELEATATAETQSPVPTAVSIQPVNPVDCLALYTETVPAAGTGAVTLPTPGQPALYAPHNYQTIAIAFGQTGATSNYQVAVALSLVLPSGFEVQTNYQVAFSGSEEVNPDANILYFPIPVPAGTQIIVTIYSTNGGPFSILGTEILGFGDLVTPTPLRNDGRSRPQHSQIASGTSGVSGTIIAGPPTPARFLIGTCNLAASGNGLLAGLQTVIGGVILTFHQVLTSAVAGSAANLNKEFPEGLLADPGAQIGLTMSAAGFVGWDVEYDLVL